MVTESADRPLHCGLLVVVVVEYLLVVVVECYRVWPSPLADTVVTPATEAREAWAVAQRLQGQINPGRQCSFFSSFAM